MGWFLGAGAKGIARWVWILAIAAVIGIVIVVASNWFDSTIEVSKEAGASEQREGDLRETLERTEEGKAAREQVETEAGAGVGDNLYALCVRNNRGQTENCQRFLPQQSADLK